MLGPCWDSPSILILLVSDKTNPKKRFVFVYSIENLAMERNVLKDE
jgi:hypothetical protein